MTGVTKITTGWHRPGCSFCGKKIRSIEQAYAGSITTGGARLPFVVHTGQHCSFYHHFEGRARLEDLPVRSWRRLPMEAVQFAMNGHDGSTASCMAWESWLSIVLGIPQRVEQDDELLVDAVADHVSNVEDIRELLDALNATLATRSEITPEINAELQRIALKRSTLA